MSDDVVTGGEFGRWRADFAAFQERLDERMDRGFGGLNSRLDDLNGRTRKNAEAIVALDGRIDAIATHGCGQLEAHRAVMEANGPEGKPWHRDKRTWVGTGVGAGVIAVLYEIISTLHAYIGKT